MLLSLGYLCLLMFVFSAAEAFVKTYQNRNINTHSYLKVIPTGYAQTAMWAIGLYVVTDTEFNPFVIFSMATGGIIGCMLAMRLHTGQHKGANNG